MTARRNLTAFGAVIGAELLLALAGCGGTTSDGQGDASANDTSLQKLDRICSQDETQIGNMVDAGVQTLNDEGITIDSAKFMANALEVMEPVFPSPDGTEDCAPDFAHLMGAIRSTGG